MAYTTLRSLLSAIANAIRSVDGSTEDINAQDFPERIQAINGFLIYSNVKIKVNALPQNVIIIGTATMEGE